MMFHGDDSFNLLKNEYRINTPRSDVTCEITLRDDVMVHVFRVEVVWTKKMNPWFCFNDS